MATEDIADRLDDLGIGILASPYLAKGLGGLASKLPGGKPVAQAANAYYRGFHKTPWGEVAGLGLVAPGVVKPLAAQVEKVMPEPVEKIAYDLGAQHVLELLC